MDGANHYRERELCWPHPWNVVGIELTCLIVDTRQQELFLVGHILVHLLSFLDKEPEPVDQARPTQQFTDEQGQCQDFHTAVKY